MYNGQRNNGYGGGYNNQRRNNYGGQRQHNGQRGEYKPNSGQLRPNIEKQRQQDPDFKGVCNVEVNGERHTFFISLWVNQDQNTGEDRFRVTFTSPNAPQAQRQGYQQRPQYAPGQEMGYGQPQHGPNGAYAQNGAYAPNGAASRARPMQQQIGGPEYGGQFQDVPPPNGPEDYEVSYPDNDTPY